MLVVGTYNIMYESYRLYSMILVGQDVIIATLYRIILWNPVKYLLLHSLNIY